jgi:hypothetical protein
LILQRRKPNQSLLPNCWPDFLKPLATDFDLNSEFEKIFLKVMNKYLFAALLLFSFGLQISAQEKTAQMGARERLIGTWRLVSAGELSPDGSIQPFPEYGPHPFGYLMYDKTGHMCVTLANPNPPHWADPEKPTDAERAVTHKGMMAYCGAYEVHEKEGQVIHRPELAEWPHYIGSDQVRNFRFEGDRLILSSEEARPGGELRRYRITWERVK